MPFGHAARVPGVERDHVERVAVVRVDGGGEAELARQPVGDLGPGVAGVVAAVHADVVLLVEAVAVARGPDEPVHAEADLLVRPRPVGAQAAVARRPARAAVGVSKAPTPCTIAQKRDGSSGSGMIAEMPRWPGGWFAGSSHSSLPGWPASVVRSDQLTPPSRLSKIPGASAPTSTRPSCTASVEIFETLRGSPSA